MLRMLMTAVCCYHSQSLQKTICSANFARILVSNFCYEMLSYRKILQYHDVRIRITICLYLI